MNILKSIAKWTAEKAGGYAGLSFSTTDHSGMEKLATLLGGGPTVTGRSVNETTAMGITTVFACGRLLAETMGALPSGIFMKQGKNSVPADDHPLNEILIYQPNIDMDGLNFRESRTLNQALRGNAYALIERRSTGDVASLYPLPAANVEVRRTDGVVEYGYPDRGKVEWYPSEKIWHHKGFSFNGLVGLSPIGLAREAFGLALAGEEFNARLFGQGLMPSARVKIPQWLTPEQRVIANAKLLEMHAGLANMNKPMLLEGGMEVSEGFLTPDDAQFLQLRQFTVIELCRLFAVKPHMIAALEKATDNNIEKLSLEFVQYTMMPYVRRDEYAARKLFKPADREKFFYRYNFEGLLRADSIARGQLYSILLQNGVFSRNEVRALENRNASTDEGMDSYTVQLNMTAIEDLGEPPETTGSEAVEPPEPGEATAPAKAADNHVHVQLPESFKHELAQRIDIPGVLEVARAVEKSNEASTAAIELLRREIADMTAETKRNSDLLAKSIEVAEMPLQAIKDEKGEIIGSRKVLKLVK